MDVLHGDLEAVETAGLGDLNFLAEPLHLVANTQHAARRRTGQGGQSMDTAAPASLPGPLQGLLLYAVLSLSCDKAGARHATCAAHRPADRGPRLSANTWRERVMGQEARREPGLQTSSHSEWGKLRRRGKEHVFSLVMEGVQADSGGRATHQVLIDDAVARRKEGQDVRNEVPLLRLQGLPVLQVLGEVHLAPGVTGGQASEKFPTFLPPSGHSPLAT